MAHGPVEVNYLIHILKRLAKKVNVANQILDILVLEVLSFGCYFDYFLSATSRIWTG